MSREKQTPEPMTNENGWPTLEASAEQRIACIRHAQAMLNDLQYLGENDLLEKLCERLGDWRLDEKRRLAGRTER